MVRFNPLDDAELLGLIRFEARQLRDKLPTGYDQDDLESVGGEAVCEAIARADRSDPGRFKATMRLTVRNRMKNFVRSLKVKGRAMSRLPADADGVALAVRDPRADDPGDRAAAREFIPAGATLPRPDEAAAKAVALRDAMFGAVRVEHVRAMMERIGERAAGGDLAASKVLIGLLDRPAAGPVQQTAVIINRGDV